MNTITVLNTGPHLVEVTGAGLILFDKKRRYASYILQPRVVSA